MNNNIIRKRTLILSIIFLLIILIVSIVFNEISKNNLFYSIDPYFHYKVSQENIMSGHVVSNNLACIENINLEYSSTLRVLTPILTLISGGNMINIYKYGGLFFFVLVILSILILSRRINKKYFFMIIPIFNNFLLYIFT